MNRTLKLILCWIIALGGLMLIALSSTFDSIYLINSIWWQIDNEFLIGTLGLVFFILAVKFAFEVEDE